jgi:N-carbamoylputrescine amidase
MKKDYKNFKIGLIQMSMQKDPESNMKKAVRFIEKAASKGAKVICLPELFRTQYFCQVEDIGNFNFAEPIPGPTTKMFKKIAADLKIVLVTSIFEKRTLGIYHNSVALINSKGKISGVYRKMHIPDDPLYYEKFYFTPGDLGYKSFKTDYGNVGTLICWDQWYPEGARLTALKGASVLFYPTAIGWHPYEKEKHGKPQFDSWLTIQRSHAISNGVYVAACNRVGVERPDKNTPGIEFWGSSFISDPQGIIIAQASTDKEEIIFGEVDMQRIEYIRRNWPFLRDRRIDSYDGIDKRFLGRN